MADTGYAIVSRAAPLFIFLHIVGGHVLIPILALTIILSRTIQRHAALVNFVLVWIPYSIAYSLLFYVNQQGSLSPLHGLCVAQGIILSATPPMCSVAALALVIQLFFGIGGRTERWTKRSRDIFKYTALGAPYVTFALFAIGFGGLQASVPFLMGPSDGVIFCSAQSEASKNPALRKSLQGIVSFSSIADPIFAVIFLVVSIGFLSVVIAGIYSRLYIHKEHIAKQDRLMISSALRLGGFLIYSLALIGATITSILGVQTAAPYIIEASLPLVVFLLFGTQDDIFEAWKELFRTVFRRPQNLKKGSFNYIA